MLRTPISLTHHKTCPVYGMRENGVTIVIETSSTLIICVGF